MKSFACVLLLHAASLSVAAQSSVQNDASSVVRPRTVNAPTTNASPLKRDGNTSAAPTTAYPNRSPNANQSQTVNQVNVRSNANTPSTTQPANPSPQQTNQTVARPQTPNAAPMPSTNRAPANASTSNNSSANPSSTPIAPSSSVIPSSQTSPYQVALPYIAMQPVKPLAPNKVERHLEEAKTRLRARVQLTAFAIPNIYIVTLAALDPDTNQVHTVSLPKATFLKRGAEVQLTTSHGTPVRVRILRPNYVNTQVAVYDLTGKQFAPLVVEYPLEKFGSYRETAYYTSAHPALITPELVKDGQTYVRTMIELAARRLKDKGFPIAPEILDVAERLAIVEHTDHQRFMTENRKQLFEEVFALFALNQLDTYRYSVSTAGAGGMVQMIPSTYYMMRRLYPSIGLNPDFVSGMRNHGNALEAMLMYMQRTWNDLLLNADVADAYYNRRIAARHELIAAGYNSNPARLGSYIRRGGANWRALIPRETQMYLQIYSALESNIPVKKRVEDTPVPRPVFNPSPLPTPSTTSAPATSITTQPNTIQPGVIQSNKPAMPSTNQPANTAPRDQPSPRLTQPNAVNNAPPQ